jgi:hypothetical protein
MIEPMGHESASSMTRQEFSGAAWPSKDWEESPPQGTPQVSRAGYLRSQNVWQHLPTKLEISF